MQRNKFSRNSCFHSVFSVQFSLVSFCFLSSFFLLTSLEAKKSLSDLQVKKSLVILETTPVYPNPIRPWMQKNEDSFHSIAIVLPNQKLLALADDVRDSGLIEVSRYNSHKKAIAKVQRIDYESNLAILSVSEKGFFRKLKALSLGSYLKIGQKVEGIRVNLLLHVYRETFPIQDIDLFSEIGYTELPQYRFHSSENFSIGGILIHKRRIYGFISYSSKKGKSQAIITPIIKAFLSSFSKSKNIYNSHVVSQGFRLSGMVDPVQREYYKIPKKYEGALVTRVLPGTSSWGVLRKGDILISIDGLSVDTLGLCKIPDWGRQVAQLIVVSSKKKKRIRKPGENIHLTILRKNKLLHLVMKLKAYYGIGSRIPDYIIGEPPYLVENGLVFLESSLPLLRSLYGNKWKQRSVLHSHLYQTRRFYENLKEKDRIILIGGVFPDLATRGLKGITGKVVEKLNGNKVKDVTDLRKHLRSLIQSGQKIAKLTLNGNRFVYLQLTDRNEINARISQKYEIPAKASRL